MVNQGKEVKCMVSFANLTGFPLVDVWLSAIITGVIAAVTLAIAFVIGYYVAKAINTAIRTAMEKAQVEKWVDDHGLGNALLGFRITQIITVWVKAFVIVAALGFGFSAIEGYLGTDLFVTSQIILPFKEYLTGIASSLIVVAGALFIAKYISNHVKKGDFLFSHHIALAIYGVIAYFVVVATLGTFLGAPGTEIAGIMKDVLIILVYAIAAVIALAFGLGLKDTVSKAASKNQTAIEKYILQLGKK